MSGPCQRPTHDQLGQQVAEPCTSQAVFDVLYHLVTEEMPRGAQLCLTHMQEIRDMRLRGLLTAFDAKAIIR